jgi:hypothetical protein
MESRSVDGLTLYFDADERETADLVEQACQQSLRLIRQSWGLDAPEGCRVYVMTSWRHFVFHSAPWPRKILLGLFMPLWALRARRIWAFSGGWTLPYRRPAVGIKPPRLIEAGDSSIGARVFVKEEDLNEKVRHVTCHELVHACSAHLKLPMWLNEGLAMVTVDRLLQTATVRTETLEVLGAPSGDASPRGYRGISVKEQETFVYAFVRGYWITRHLEETQPELLKSLLAQRLSHRALESRVAAAYQMEREEFWQQIDPIVASHFRAREAA